MSAGSDQGSVLSQMLTAGSEQSMPLDQLLEQLTRDDPRLALVASYLSAQHAAEEAAAAAELDDEPDDAFVELGRKEAQPGQELRRRLSLVSADLARARLLCETLATALGACDRCWGSHPACPDCRGAGRPGFVPPDPQLFREYVLPAAQRFRAEARAGATPERARGPVDSSDSTTSRDGRYP